MILRKDSLVQAYMSCVVSKMLVFLSGGIQFPESESPCRLPADAGSGALLQCLSTGIFILILLTPQYISVHVALLKQNFLAVFMFLYI